jgi:putative hemolysin
MAVVLFITYLSLIFGELVPKRLALQSPERIASALAPVMNVLSRIAAPLVSILSASTRAVFAVLPLRESTEPAVTEEEFKLLLRQATQAGTIERRERDIVERVFRLGDRRVTAVMTPRVDVVWLDLNRPLDEIRAIASEAGHTRFPVAEGKVDNIIGIVHARDLWGANATSDLQAHLHPPLIVPKNTPAFELLEQFRETRNHVALVADEFGGVVGFVTPADILQALVGELPETGDDSGPAVLQRSDGTWSFDASVDLEEAKSVLDVHTRLEGQKEQEFQTIAGYVIQRLGHIPKLGETVDAGGYRFEILDMDGRRVDRILATRVETIV